MINSQFSQISGGKSHNKGHAYHCRLGLFDTRHCILPTCSLWARPPAIKAGERSDTSAIGSEISIDTLSRPGMQVAQVISGTERMRSLRPTEDERQKSLPGRVSRYGHVTQLSTLSLLLLHSHFHIHVRDGRCLISYKLYLRTLVMNYTTQHCEKVQGLHVWDP